VQLILYSATPVAGESGPRALVELIAGLALFAAILPWLALSIVKAELPELRAVEAMAVAVLVLITVFAYTYLSLSRDNPARFSEPLDHTSAIYFTVTTLGTVGYGDITGKTEATRIFITIQILLDLVVLIAIARTVLFAARTGLRRQQQKPPSSTRKARPGDKAQPPTSRPSTTAAVDQRAHAQPASGTAAATSAFHASERPPAPADRLELAAGLRLKAELGHVGRAHPGGGPSVRTMGRGDALPVQGLGDLGKGFAFREERSDLRAPSVVSVVAPDVGQSNVLGDEVAARRLKHRVVVVRGRPLGARRRDRIERAAPLVVVALRHLALQGEELAALGHLHEDTLHAELA
jgi:voltage-gated potassium channel